MSSYTIPPTLKEGREKIIGGVLDIVQAAYILLALSIWVTVFLLLAKINKIFAGVVGLFFAAPIIPLAFIKIKGYSVVTYIKYKKKFSKKVKYLPNKKKI